ncbi:hypothetical protein UA08_08707 [Talaromyces atroroseus]|uniref:Zn(2)-C6 fungal-type domain-containing protein n=1 Tax=Talaromyces atroroseus TaxID=1441469 RepID=A0A225A6S8_TALAT|nr:hypothetical protein UA08_08707 [Talaromyces atroroseus]OKL56122.1 hypothetical protein UA08_08707 [Talaromyces atroroseus]
MPRKEDDMEETGKRHCWECRRRRLVCDFTRPECNRCSRAGIVCPRYGDTKPLSLKWLVPGVVQSHDRRPRKRNVGNIPDATAERSLANARGMAVSPRHMEMIVPAESDLVQATEYFNAYVGPSIQPVLEVVPEFGIPLISPAIFQKCLGCPSHIRHFMICTALGHRMNHNGAQCNALERKYLHYRGLMIKSLRSDINVECTAGRRGGYTIAGILALLLTDARQGASYQSWRHHLEGIRKIIKLRGGMRVSSGTVGIMPSLNLFMLTAVLGDTTSPASDLAILPAHLEDVEYMVNTHADENHALYIMFPSPLFAGTAKTNYLRMRAAKDKSVEAGELAHEAYDILDVVLSFSPENWAKTKTKALQKDCMLLGNLYKAAVALFCISSLQSVSALPMTPFLTRTCAALSQQLQSFLGEALLSQKFERIIIWPLVVLGAEAVRGDAAMRDFVRKGLLEVSGYTGTITPRMAKSVVERFWASGKTRWDDCFDESYMFLGAHGIDCREL